MVVRAFYFRLAGIGDGESPYSRLRDAEAPLFLAVLALGRVRLSPRQTRSVAISLIVLGVVLGVIGVLQFFNGSPYLFDGIDDTLFKTRYANKYFIAKLFHLEVKQIARGFHYFSINYAFTLIAPSVVAFCLAWRARGWSRVLAALAFAVMYLGLYFSFSRSVIGVMPVACVLAVLAMRGWLRAWMCVGLVIAYIGLAYIGPMHGITLLGDDDFGTLNARYDSLLSYVREVKRDPGILLFGGTIASWREWEVIVPHNWVVNSLLTDGIPATALRIGSYIGLLVALFPARRGRLAPALHAGLWCSSFTLLAVVGETEPLAGISPYLSGVLPLVLLAAADAAGGAVDGAGALRSRVQ
jgi:hypothetical protein